MNQITISSIGIAQAYNLVQTIAKLDALIADHIDCNGDPAYLATRFSAATEFTLDRDILCDALNEQRARYCDVLGQSGIILSEQS